MSIAMQNGGGIHYQTTPALAAKDAEIARLRAEVEGLRNALEKIASIRLNDHASIDAAYGHACSIANEALFDHSDAAMGASA